MHQCGRALLALGLAGWLEGCMAQVFQWKFTGSLISTTLTQCQTYPIMVQNRTNPGPNITAGVGTPPYYMIAFKPGGIPTTSLIGSDPNNLTWRVNQPSGSNLILSITDSEGVSGGEPPNLYTVADGDSTCLPPAPTVNVTLTPNITTGTVTTCQQMGFLVTGGQKPYNISLAALNSPVVTNVTMGPTDDVFVYIDRADPNGDLIVAVSDANGVWGTGSGIFTTQGSNNTDCVGLVSKSGNQTSIDLHPKPPKKSNHTTIVVAVIVPVVAVLLLVCGTAYYIRRKRLEEMREPEPAFLPDAWQGPSIHGDGTSTTYTPYDPPPSSKYERYRDEVVSGRASSSNIGMSPLVPNRPGPSSELGSMSGSGSGSGGGGGGWGPGGVPVRASASGKLVPNRPYTLSDMSHGSSSRLPPGVSPEWAIESPDIIIQHRDGGAVQEIPPPYMQATSAGSSSNLAGGSASGAGGSGISTSPPPKPQS